MQMQRRLSGLERDLADIHAKSTCEIMRTPQYLFLRERLNAHEQGMYSLFINVFNFKFYILKILLTKKENDLAMYLAR